jgi:hypothetical protein
MRVVIALTVVALGGSFLFSSCRKCHSTVHIRMVDSLLHVLYTEDSLCALLAHEPLQAMSDSALEWTQEVHRNYGREVDEEMAKNMSRLVLSGKSAERLLAVLNNLSQESARLKKQLVVLKEALENGATHDARGNELTSDYTARCIFEEQEALKKMTSSREHAVLVLADLKRKFDDQATIFKEWRSSWK